MLVDYAGMNAAEIAAWLLIATAAGFAGRALVKGKPIFGLWGDAAIGLVGVFLLGTLMRAFHFDFTQWLMSFLPNFTAAFTIWIDIAITSLVGAILIRAVLRPFTGGS